MIRKYDFKLLIKNMNSNYTNSNVLKFLKSYFLNKKKFLMFPRFDKNFMLIKKKNKFFSNDSGT